MRKRLCICGHDDHDENGICAKCQDDYCESRESLRVTLLLPTEEEYAELVAALKQFVVVESVELER